MSFLKNLTHLSIKDLKGGIDGISKGLERGAGMEAEKRKAVEPVKEGDKPKFSAAGNFLAGFANAATGGVLGTRIAERSAWFNDQKADTLKGFNRLMLDAGLNPVEVGKIGYGALDGKVGNDVQGVLDKVAQTKEAQTIIERLTSSATKAGTAILKSKSMDWIKKNWLFLLIPFGLVIYYLFFRQKTGSSRYRKSRGKKGWF